MCKVLRGVLCTAPKYYARSAMGNGKDLTEEEKSYILALADESKTVRYIAERVKRTKTAVHNDITTSKSKQKKNHSGPKHRITKPQHRGIVRAASKGVRTAREIL